MPRVSKSAAAKKARTKRRGELARSIASTYESLRSHLGDAVAKRKHGAGYPNSPEWEARCVKEYAQVIQTLATELHELVKQDYKDVVEPLEAKLNG